MGEVDVFVVGVLDQRDGVFENSHHAEAEQVHFNDSHVGAIFFVPLHDYAAGHGGRFERHDGIELALADHHAAGVLSEVAGQVLYGHVEVEEFGNERVVQGQSSIAKLPVGRFFWIGPAPGRDHG